MNHGPRRAAALIIVSGLASILLGLTLAFIARARSDAQEMAQVVADGQARIMLNAALMYLQEGSRIGWSSRSLEIAPGGTLRSGWREDAAGGTTAVVDVTTYGGESHGWTDIRNGWLGPLPDRDPATGAIPNPTWWTTGYRPQPDDASLGVAVWPMPGSVFRSAPIVPMVTPYAISARAAYNPMNMNVQYGAANWDTAIGSNVHGTNTTYWNYLWNQPVMMGLLDPQPIMDNWTGLAGGVEDFQTGRLEVSNNRASSLAIDEQTRNRCWFRIYRERLEDHDGDGLAPGGSSLYYDRVVISQQDGSSWQGKNWNVFVITCGAGATQGYKNWAEVAASGATALFANDRAMFEDLRRREIIQWWRVEWSAQVGGINVDDIYEGLDYNIDQNNFAQISQQRAQNWYATVVSQGGNFKWIQRLYPPPDWVANGNW